MLIAIVNGPNLNLLGKREPAIYGTRSWEDYLPELQARFPQVEIRYLQSNHEGDLIDYLQALDTPDCAGIILNAGGYTHTSVALRDTVAAIGTKVVEVHISDITQRETFRHFSYLTDVCWATIMGQGLEGYALAIEKILQQ